MTLSKKLQDLLISFNEEQLLYKEKCKQKFSSYLKICKFIFLICKIRIVCRPCLSFVCPCDMGHMLHLMNFCQIWRDFKIRGWVFIFYTAPYSFVGNACWNFYSHIPQRVVGEVLCIAIFRMLFVCFCLFFDIPSHAEWLVCLLFTCFNLSWIEVGLRKWSSDDGLLGITSVLNVSLF